MTTMLQTMVKEEFRGRVMSIYILMFLGMAPIGNFEIGLLTEKLGISYAITFNAIIVIIFGGYLFSKRRKVKLQYLKYKKAHPAPR